LTPEVLPCNTGGKATHRRKRSSISKKTGLPINSKYIADLHPAAAYEITCCGAGINELARILGFDPQTILNWKARYMEFADAIIKGRRVYGSTQVEHGILDRAKGYTYDEVRIEGIMLVGKGADGAYYIEQKKGSGKEATTELVLGFKKVVTTKKVHADVAAACFWLCNRQPDDWKNVQRQEVVGKVEVEHKHVLDLTKLDRDKLEQLHNITAEAATSGDANDDGAGGISTRQSQLASFREAALAIR